MKYYKAEDVINKVAEYISSDYPTEEMAREDAALIFADLSTLEASEDAISREWLVKRWNEMSVRGRTEFDQEIMVALSVIPKPKEGEWILECDAEGEGDNLYRCPECRQRCGCQEYDLPNYCGNCGAKMKKNK